MLQNSLKYTSKCQPVTLVFSSECVKHIGLDNYETYETYPEMNDIQTPVYSLWHQMQNQEYQLLV